MTSGTSASGSKADSRQPDGAPPPGNLLLAQLPPDELARLRSRLTTVEVPCGHTYQRINQPLTAVHFLRSGVGSVVSTMSDGTAVETTVVGREGMIGIEALFSAEPLTVAECVQQVGDAVVDSMSVADFRRELDESVEFRRLIDRYGGVRLAIAMRSAACNALHDLAARCARWLLMAQDRMGVAQFAMSHEYLAMMLGVHRPTVSVAAGALQRAGIIAYRHGTVSIVDRARLEAESCECYVDMRHQFERAGLLYPCN
jgi:CRP-like cAMP-binding protein